MSTPFLEPVTNVKTEYSGWRRPSKKDKPIDANPKLVRRRRVQEDLLALRDIEQQFKL
ncbi:hypothetical protein [Pseudoalteromonas rhizosphaerae]|uniref:hypothetical protein n=1 Tax=Pseudoalteromonas rhizosphaerae TaxID=2518973 RepID=UPI0015D3029E|nr:hypothetical protein [Pseudoalteromonas rhizosphaerae]